MKRIILALLILCGTVPAFAQPTSGDVFPPVGGPTDFWHTGGLLTSDRQIRLTYSDTLVLLYKTDGSIRYDTTKKQVKVYDGAYWRRLIDSAYLDTVVSSIEAGAVDTVNYIASITRLDREIDSVSNITDSLYNVMITKQGADSLLLALQIDTLQSDVYVLDSTVGVLVDQMATVQSDIVTIDSAVGVAFGAISALYDTLPNYVDTAQLNDSLQVVKALINLKQNYSDTTTWDATRYWVSTQIPSLSGYVPYTGATGNVDIGTHTFTAKDGVFNHSSGSGVALSVTKGGAGEALTVNKTSGSGNAMSVTGGVTQLSELHTTTPIADAYIASAATWNAKGTVNSVATGYGLTGGTITTTGTLIADSTLLATKLLVKKQIDSVAALSGGGGGGSPISASPFNMLYKSSTDTIRGTDKAYIDTTDNRLVFANDTTTTAVNTDPNGGTKVFGSNRMGMAALRLLDTVSIPAALQRAINAQTASLMFPVFPGIVFTNNYLYTGMLSTVGTPSYVVAAYNSTIQHFNWNKYLLTTASGANSNALIRTTGITNPAGIICGNTKFSGGGGRGTFTFSFPAYLSTERIMIGYVGAGVAAISADPSSMVGSTASLLLIKDAADATLSFMHTNTSGGAATKVNTGITPNSEDVYRLTVYIAPNSTYYMQLEVLSKSAPTRVVTINPTTNIPPVSSRMVSYQGVNNGSVGGVVAYGIIQVMEEIY